MYGGQTDLGDYYRGTLSLRQILARIECLPADAPLQRLLADEFEKAEERRSMQEHDAVLAVFDGKE